MDTWDQLYGYKQATLEFLSNGTMTAKHGYVTVNGTDYTGFKAYQSTNNKAALLETNGVASYFIHRNENNNSSLYIELNDNGITEGAWLKQYADGTTSSALLLHTGNMHYITDWLSTITVPAAALSVSGNASINGSMTVAGTLTATTRLVCGDKSTPFECSRYIDIHYDGSEDFAMRFFVLSSNTNSLYLQSSASNQYLVLHPSWLAFNNGRNGQIITGTINSGGDHFCAIDACGASGAGTARLAVYYDNEYTPGTLVQQWNSSGTYVYEANLLNTSYIHYTPRTDGLRYMRFETYDLTPSINGEICWTIG